MKKLITALFVLSTIAAFVQANTQDANDPNVVPKIIVSGTGDNQAILRALAEAFTKKLDGKCLIEVPDAIGSSAGIKALAKGEIDIARIARPLKKEEQESGLDYKIFALTAIVFVVNPSVTGIDNITAERIIDIYSGKIIDWKDLGASPGKIYPLTREPGDSALRVFGETFPEFNKIITPAAKVMFLTPEAVAALQQYKNTIGFLPYSAAVGTDLKVLKLNGLEPSAENITGGQYKHLIPLGVAYKKHPGGLVKEFIDFLNTEDANNIIEKMGVVPVK